MKPPLADAAWPGSPAPLGATWDGAGINVAVYSESAEAVELCFFDVTRDGRFDPSSERRMALMERSGAVWHGYVPGCGPGQRYGFRCFRPLRPGQRSAPQPREAAARPVRPPAGWTTSTSHPAIFGFTGDPAAAPVDHTDSAPFVPHGVVTAGDFPWDNDSPPRIPWPPRPRSTNCT